MQNKAPLCPESNQDVLQKTNLKYLSLYITVQYILFYILFLSVIASIGCSMRYTSIPFQTQLDLLTLSENCLLWQCVEEARHRGMSDSIVCVTLCLPLASYLYPSLPLISHNPMRAVGCNGACYSSKCVHKCLFFFLNFRFNLQQARIVVVKY